MDNIKFKNGLVKVKVTERDIDRAKKLVLHGGFASRCCPNALAINRALRAKFRRHHFTSTVAGGDFDLYEGPIVSKNLVCTGFKLPDEARKIISDFDAKNEVQPVEYVVDLAKRYT